jgi:hypothetical protein
MASAIPYVFQYDFYETTRTGFRKKSGELTWNSEFLNLTSSSSSPEIENWKTFWSKNTSPPKIISGTYPKNVSEFLSSSEPIILGYPSRKENDEAISWMREWYSRRGVEHPASDYANSLKGTLLILYKNTLLDIVSNQSVKEELIEETKEEPKDEIKEETKEEPKDEIKEEPSGNPRVTNKRKSRKPKEDKTETETNTEKEGKDASSETPKKRRIRTTKGTRGGSKPTVPLTEEEIEIEKEETKLQLEAMYPPSCLSSECLLNSSHRLLYTGHEIDLKELMEVPEEITEDDSERLEIPIKVPPPQSLVFARNRVRYILNEIFADPILSVEAECGILQESIVLANNQGIPAKWQNMYFKKSYEVLFQKVYKNLGSLGNVRLLERIRSGEVKARNLAGMIPMDLWPEKWMEIENERIKKQIAGFEITAEGATDMFQCPRCHQRKCKYHEVQTRSADEPMTAFILCLNCGKRWRE